jgi:hypothetical protein
VRTRTTVGYLLPVLQAQVSTIPIDDAPPIVLFDDQIDTLLRVEYEESKQETIPMRLLDK